MASSSIELSLILSPPALSLLIVTSLLPPPTGVFATREDLLKHIRDFAFSQGYAVIIKDSIKNRWIYLGCDRSSKYQNRLNLTDET